MEETLGTIFIGEKKNTYFYLITNNLQKTIIRLVVLSPKTLLV
jgi:hypothetical protein